MGKKITDVTRVKGLKKNRNTRGDSPLWADARLGSAHAPNYRGYMQIEAANATVLLRGINRLIEEKENTGIIFNEPATKFAIRHTMTNKSRK